MQRTRPTLDAWNVAALLFGALLLAKFLWTLAAYEAPLGYDAGFYRYLFARYADALPPFVLPELDPWAREHPTGLFVFTSLLQWLGASTDWLIGWIWNLVAALPGFALAWAWGGREGRVVGILTLLMAALSPAYFDGFVAMYWKTYVALTFCVVSFRLLEKRSVWGAVFGLLTVVTHHQTGLLYVLAVGAWLVYPVVYRLVFPSVQKPASRFVWTSKTTFGLLSITAVLAVGIAWYLPVWNDVIAVHLPRLLTGDAPGNFPPLSYYLRTSGPLLAAGLCGFWLQMRRERLTLWQSAFLWSAAFVLLRLFFYRRFYLQAEFFLLPFAALAVAATLPRWRNAMAASLVALLLATQAFLTVRSAAATRASVDGTTYAAIRQLPGLVPADAWVIALENITAPLVRGWLHDRHVGGPGLFESTWGFEQWEQFLVGSSEQRRSLLGQLPAPTYLFVSDFFRAHYGEAGEAFLADPCFQPTAEPWLVAVKASCSIPSSPQ